MIIKKKIWPKYFEAVISGKKNFELRLNDFDIAEGDVLVLEEWDPETKNYTGRSIEKKVTYVGKFKIDDLFWPESEIKEKGVQIISLEPEPKPKVGIGVMILKDGRVLLGKRKGAHGEGEYAFPGGHLEYKESFEECARRETTEESGIEIENIRFQFLKNLMKYLPKHYTHIGLIADWKSGEPKVLEPDKLESWAWYDLDNLPSPMFDTCRVAVESYKTGKNYFDS